MKNWILFGVIFDADKISKDLINLRNKTEDQDFWSDPENCVIMKAHQALVDAIEAFNLSGMWYAPPMHKISIMTEAYFAEYEAHESVEKYLHERLHKMRGDIHERIRSECKRVAEAALEQLARRNLCACGLSVRASRVKAFPAAFELIGAGVADWQGASTHGAQPPARIERRRRPVAISFALVIACVPLICLRTRSFELAPSLC